MRTFLVLFCACAGLSWSCTSSITTISSGAASPDGGANEGAGPDAADADAPPPAKILGYVTAQTEGATAADGYYQVSAVFYRPDTPVVACTKTVEGSCTFSACDWDAARDGGTKTEYLQAGRITMTGGTDTVRLEPQPDGSYQVVNVQKKLLWKGGESLRFVAPGGADVPELDVSITAPTPPKMTSPSAFDSAISIPRSEDFAIAWSGDAADVVSLTLSTEDSSKILACQFAASAGSGTVPASLLGNLPAGKGRIDVLGEGKKTVRIGDADVEVTAEQHAVGARAGTIALGTVTYR